MTSRAGVAALIAATAFWGSTVATVKTASDGTSALGITLVEVVTAAGLLVLACRLRGVRLPRPSRRLLLPGLVEPGLAYLLLNEGITRTSGTHAAVLIGTESVFVVSLAALAARTVPSRPVLAGLVLAVAGASLAADTGSGTASLPGDLLVLAGVITAAAYVPLAYRLTQDLAALPATAYQFLAGVVVVAPLAAVRAAGSGWAELAPASSRYWAAAALSGLLGSVAAFLLYNWALARVSQVLAGTALTLIPVFGVLAAVVLLDESLTLSSIAAVAAVVLGVIVTGRADVAAARRGVGGGRVAAR